MGSPKVICTCNTPPTAITVVPKVAFEGKTNMSLAPMVEQLREKEANYVLQTDPIVNVSVNVNVRDAIEQPAGDSKNPDKRRFRFVSQSGRKKNAPPPSAD